MDTSLLKILEQEKEQLLVKLHLIERTIFAYRHGAIIFPDNKINGLEPVFDYGLLQQRTAGLDRYLHYDINQPSKNKVLLIIKTENRFLHVREIARIMQQLEEGSDMQQLIRKISPALSLLKKIPDTFLVSIEVDQSHFNTFWGCKDWLTVEGEIKTPHTYNAAEVSKSARLSLLSLK